jgi:RNA polymerase sigma factor (sigma-70 family)
MRQAHNETQGKLRKNDASRRPHWLYQIKRAVNRNEAPWGKKPMARCVNELSVRQINTLFRVGAVGGLTDRELLEQFLAGDEAELAFAVLVERHGPMVRSLCRSLLGDFHEADDAFQATFLVLARRAGSIRDKEALASWLYRIAYRLCLRIRAEAKRRRALSQHLAERAQYESTTGSQPPIEHMPELFEEVARLPDRYRAPIVLCYLEGQTHEQAARSLRCPLRTVQTRLLRAKAKLRSGLERRGLAPTIGLLTAGIATAESSAAVAPALPAALAESTARAAAQFAATEAAGMIGTTILSLADQALRALLWSRLKQGAGLTISLMLGVAVTFFTLFAAEKQPNQPVKTILADEKKPNAPLKAITGRVVDTQGRPIAGAQVWMPVKFDESDRSTARATTDANGHYTLAAPELWSQLPLHARRWCIWAYANGHQIATATAYEQLSSGKADPVDLTLGPATTTSFRVLDPDGQPLAGAVVAPYHLKTPVAYENPPSTMLPVLRSVSDATGRAMLPALPQKGFMTVQVTSKAFGAQQLGLFSAPPGPILPTGQGPTPPATPQQLPLDQAEAEPAERTLRLREVGRVEGRIVTSRPEWAAGVTVYVTTSTSQFFVGLGNIEGTATVVTQPDGSFVIPAVAAGQLQIGARVNLSLPVRPRFPLTLEVRSGESTRVEIALEKAVRVRGVVRVKDTGEPATGLSILIGYGSGHDTVVSDAKGQYEGFALPGEVSTQIIAFPDGFTPPMVITEGKHHIPPGTETFDLPAIEVVRGVPPQK